MNKKGQALVEFILVLPILLLIIISMIDIGNVFLKKFDLNNDLETVATLYENGDMTNLNDYLEEENINLSENSKDDMITLTLSQKVSISTPVIQQVLGSNYEIKTSKTIFKQ